MRLFKFEKIKILGLLAVLSLVTACGGGGSVGDQFTIDIQGTLTVGDPAALSTEKLQIINGQSQVMIGTTIVEIRDNFTEDIEVELVALDLKANVEGIGEVQLTITPQITNGGTLYKRDELGIPFGVSFLDVEMGIEIPGADPSSIDLGQIDFQADPVDPNKLPVLGDIPLINFVFNGQDKRAEITELVILITPELAEVLD